MGIRTVSACALAAALGVSACSSGGSSGSAGGCTSWVVSQDGAVAASEYGSGACSDHGNLLTQNAGTLTHVSGTPTHGSQVCNVPVSGGIGWRVYVGARGGPNGEAQGVCAMFGVATAQQKSQAASSASVAAQRLPGDIGTLESDTRALTSGGSNSESLGALSQISGDLTTLKGDLQNEKSDYQAEQGNYQSKCLDGPVGSVASSVESDASQVDSDLRNALQADIDASKNSVLNPNFIGVGVVELDISNLNKDVAALRRVGQTPSQDPSEAITAAEKAINATNSATAHALKEGNAIDAQAHQIASRAQQLAQAATKQPWFQSANNGC